MNLDAKKQRMAQFISNLPIAPPSDSWFIHFTPRIKTLQMSIIQTELKHDRSVPRRVAAVELGVPPSQRSDTKLSRFPNSTDDETLDDARVSAPLRPESATSYWGQGAPLGVCRRPPLGSVWTSSERSGPLGVIYTPPQPPTLLHSSAKC